MKNIIKNPPPEYEEDIELNKKVNKRLEVNMCVSQKRKHMWPQTYEEIFSTWIMREQMTTQQDHISLTGVAEFRRCDRFKCRRVWIHRFSSMYQMTVNYSNCFGE